MSSRASSSLVTGPAGFRARLVDSRVWRGFWATFGALFEEVALRVDGDGLEVVGLDPSKTVIAHARLDPAFFDPFGRHEDLECGLIPRDLWKIAKRVEPGDVFSIFLDPNRNLFNCIIARGHPKLEREFSTAFVEYKGHGLRVGDLGTIDLVRPNRVTLDPDLLAEAVRDARLYGDTLGLQVTRYNEFHLTASSEVGDLKYRIDAGSLERLVPGHPGTAWYSALALEKVVKVAPVVPEFLLEFEPQAPCTVACKLQGEIAGILVEYGWLRVTISPRMID